MHVPRYSSVLLVLTTVLCGCTKIYEQEKYKRPDWLAGKLYTQVSQQENLSAFTKALELTGYDTIINVSGSYTVFAPSDEAFSLFFSENPQYGKSVSDIPKDELTRIVKFHIIQNAWSKEQLQMLDIGGWIDPNDPESEPRAYKKQTLLKDSNKKYWVKTYRGEHTIVDSAEANDYKTVFTRSRKYVPVYYMDFFDIFNLSPDDYEFYFGRPFDGNYLYYANARVGDEEIFAENGFVYIIDQVVLPLLNGRQILERELPGETYRTFLEMINTFPVFEFNPEATFDQPAAREGKLYDSLFDLRYPELPFDLHEELTGPSTTVSDYTYLYHNAMFIPTDVGFQKFLDEIVTFKSGYPHWPDFESIPLDIKKIILNTHFAWNPVYRTDIIGGFENADRNIIKIDEANILRKEFGSNCTFLGLNNAIVPRAFSSVTGPVYLRPGYSTFMYAMQYCNVLSPVTEENTEYCFFAIPDEVFEEDSSLMLEWIDKDLNRYRFTALDKANLRVVPIGRTDLARWILNQVGISLPDGTANKEFIENLAGNYIIWNNTDQTVRGGLPSVFGYRGDSVITIHPEIFEEPADNGRSYSVNGWFNHTKSTVWASLSRYTKFKDLLQKAGLYNPSLYEFTLMSEGEFYTIFIPSAEALDNYGLDTLSTGDLEKLLRYHFVRGELIFTDGKKPWQDYETLRIDESSTPYSTYYSTIDIKPGPDIIEILDAGGTPYITIPEVPGKTNILVVTDTDEESPSEMDYITTALIHEIDTVLVKQ
jgi:uncharacterized surface protein with fasciclin (FAS1) repeats